MARRSDESSDRFAWRPGDVTIVRGAGKAAPLTATSPQRGIPVRPKVDPAAVAKYLGLKKAPQE